MSGCGPSSTYYGGRQTFDIGDRVILTPYNTSTVVTGSAVEYASDFDGNTWVCKWTHVDSGKHICDALDTSPANITATVQHDYTIFDTPVDLHIYEQKTEVIIAATYNSNIDVQFTYKYTNVNSALAKFTDAIDLKYCYKYDTSLDRLVFHTNGFYADPLAKYTVSSATFLQDDNVIQYGGHLDDGTLWGATLHQVLPGNNTDILDSAKSTDTTLTYNVFGEKRNFYYTRIDGASAAICALTDDSYFLVAVYSTSPDDLKEAVSMAADVYYEWEGAE